DQRVKRAAGGDRIGEERQREISLREPLRHNAGPDDGGEEKGRADRFGDDAARERRTHPCGVSGFIIHRAVSGQRLANSLVARMLAGAESRAIRMKSAAAKKSAAVVVRRKTRCTASLAA